MKRKGNLSEELYKMRKLMNFNSEKFRAETTSLDRLVEEKMMEKYLLNEQEVSNDPFAGDEDCDNNLTSQLAYEPFKTYMLKNKGKKGKIGQTLEYWGGSGGTKKSTLGLLKLMDNAIKNSNTYINKLTELYPNDTNKQEEWKNALTNFIEILDEKKQNNQVIRKWGERSNNGGDLWQKFQVDEKDFKSNDYHLNKKLPADLLSVFERWLTTKKDVGFGETTDQLAFVYNSGGSLDCKTKYELLNSLLGRIEKNGKKIKRAKYIKVNPSHVTSTDTQQGDTVTTEQETIALSYPDVKSEDYEKLSTSMMGDNGYSLTPDGEISLKGIIASGIKSILDKKNGKVLGFIYGSIASTSTVSTKFTGKKDELGKDIPDIKSKKDNNKPLVDARINSINTYLKKTIDESIENLPSKDDIKILEGESERLPNQGPEWNSVNPGNKQKGIYKGGYGPLFLKQYKKNTKLTPRFFYRNRNAEDAKKWGLTEEELKKEYNDVFGPYRFNAGWVKILGEWSDAEETPDTYTSTDNKWRISVKWFKLPDWPPPKVRGGKVSTYPMEFSMDCWVAF